MVLTATKPIIVTFEGVPAMQYHIYTVGLRYVDGNAYAYSTIYTGRTWADSSRRASMRIDGILHDYVAHWQSLFEAQTQQQHPTNIKATNAIIKPIEDGTQFIITEVVVECADQKQHINVWSGFVAPWQTVDLPTDEEGNPEACNLALVGSGVLPHVPPLHSSNMYVGLSMYFPRLVDGLYSIGFAQLHRFNLNVEGAGTMLVSWTLTDLFAALAQQTLIDGETPTSTATTLIDGGTPTSTAAVVIDGGTPIRTATNTDAITTGVLYFYEGDERGDAFCIVDDCTADYYVSWELPGGGWTCCGFRGNATIGGTPTTTAMQTANECDELLTISEQHIFNLYTEPLTQTQYGHLATLKYARQAYVFDSRTDKGYYCNVDSRAIDTMPTRTGKLKPFNVALKEIQHLSL